MRVTLNFKLLCLIAVLQIGITAMFVGYWSHIESRKLSEETVMLAEADQTKTIWSEHSQMILAVLAFCLVTSLTAGVVYADSLTSPIRVLVGAAKQITDGDFEIRLSLSRSDEFRDLFQAFNRMALGLRERDRIKETFHKFHDPEIAKWLLSEKTRLGGQVLDAAILSIDIRGFTSLAERLSPQAIVATLNQVLDPIIQVIHAHGGVIDKFIGDAVLAHWGVPFPKSNDCLLALQSCMEIRRALDDLNSRRQKRGEGPLRIGMGLHYGPVVAGNIGSARKMEYTVIGDVVNSAFRLETETKTVQTDLLVSRSVKDRVAASFSFIPCGDFLLKGKTERIEVFKVEPLTVSKLLKAG